jgi:hypothetical protein
MTAATGTGLAGVGGVAATRFQSRMTRKQIPWQIVGGITQAGSRIVSSYAR